MADCFPPESDDLHRRWLPREIFADIGIVDPEEPTPEAAAAAGVEELAAQLAGILGGGAKVWPLAPPPPPPVAAPCHGAKVCGLEGNVVVSCGATNGGGVGGAVSWPFVPYPQLQWQVGSNLVNHGGVLDYPVLPPALPWHRVPPPANLRGGTGVFLPRVEAYRHAAAAPPATAKGGAATKPTWAWTASRPAAKKQERLFPQKKKEAGKAAAAAADRAGDADKAAPEAGHHRRCAGAAPGLELPLMMCWRRPRACVHGHGHGWTRRCQDDAEQDCIRIRSRVVL